MVKIATPAVGPAQTLCTQYRTNVHVFLKFGVCAGDVTRRVEDVSFLIFSQDVASMLRRRSIGKGVDAGWQRARVKWQGRAGSLIVSCSFRELLVVSADA